MYSHSLYFCVILMLEIPYSLPQKISEPVSQSTTVSAFTILKSNRATTAVGLLNYDTTVLSRTTKEVWPRKLDCNFDVDLCDWSQSSEDDFDWRHGFGSDAHMKRRGKKTGTKVDSKGDKNGGYMYIKATRNTRVSKLRGPWFLIPSAGCFTFWYHMSGRHIGDLQLSMKSATTTETSLWKLSGKQNSQWQMASVPLKMVGTNMTLLFEALDISEGRLGNIAIDDVQLLPLTNTTCTPTPSEAFKNIPSFVQSTFPTTQTQTFASISSSSTSSPSNKVSSTSAMVTSQWTSTKSTNSSRVAGLSFKTKTKLSIVFGILSAFVILAMALLGCINYRKKRRFRYYDNSIVAMERMSPSEFDNAVEYQKLTAN